MLWNNVETKPGKLLPREAYGDVVPLNHEQVYFKGESSLLAQERPMGMGANWDEDSSQGTYPNNYHFYLPRLCNHCTRPACLEACPVRAIYKREQDGIVLVDQDKCQGFRECNKACPYNYVPPMLPPPFDENGDAMDDEPRVPMEYLRFLFGPEVDEALATMHFEMEKRQDGKPSELMDLLIAKEWKSLFNIPDVRVY
jgi:ferredoxin